MKVIIDSKELDLTILRLTHQLQEDIDANDELVIIGIQPRGVKFSDRVVAQLRQLRKEDRILYGLLDITFYRDDVRQELHVANKTDMPFSIEGKRVILMDDVLFTGRTVRAALDALQDFGRPASVKLCVLVDRLYNRELPVRPDYCGKAIDSSMTQEVKVSWEKGCVELY
jgi:pyrimidine operon attenuation protein/uracil phosphoribosyltransferase